MKFFQFFLCLLNISSFVRCWDADYLTSQLIPICQLIRIQELLWFPSKNLSMENSLKVEKIILDMQKTLQVTQMVITNRSDLRLIATDMKNIYLGMVFTTNPIDPILYVHDRALLEKRSSLNIIVVMDIVDDFNVVKRYLEDLSRRNFPMSSVYIKNSNGTNSFWGFNNFVLEKRTDIFGWLIKNFKQIISGSLDTEGRIFKSPLRLDIPYVFPQKHATGKVTLQGTSYKMIEHFIKYINASLERYPMPLDKLGGEVIDIKSALNLVREKKIEFMAHAYALYTIDDDIDKSYPLMVVKWCLMVPVWNTVSTFYYPIQPFDMLVWFLFLGTFFSLVAIDVLHVVWQQFKSTKLNNTRKNSYFLSILSSSILNDFCFVLNISTGKNLQRPKTLIRALIFFTVFFYSFFLSANYSALLGSILTVNIFREDINTMEDLIRTNISVMIINYELEFLLANGNDLSIEFKKLLLAVDAATFNRHQLVLNTSFAYFVTEDKWHFLSLQQKYLKQRLFKFTDICFGSHHLAYPMRKYSPIWRNLEFYIYRMHSSGMLQYYESKAFDFAVHSGYMKRLTDANEYNSAGLKHLFMLFMLLLLVFCLSSIIFFGECLLFWYIKGRKKLGNKRMDL